MQVYKKIVRGICMAFEIFAAVSLGAMVVVVAWQVIMRYFFHDTPGWTEETARQLMILFCFIAMTLGVRDKIHIALTMIAERLLKRILLPLEILGKVLIFILGIMMSCFMGPYFTKLRYNRLPATGIPVGWEYAIPTAMGALMSLVALYQIYDHFTSGTEEEQRQAGDFSKGDSSL